MSIFPLFKASFIGLFLVGVFCWYVNVLWVVIICVLMSLFLFVYESCVSKLYHYESAFWLFIFSEIIVFGTLLFCCLYFDTWYFMNLSSSLEIPFLGCFVLLGSSITITAFHHLFYWCYSDILLFLTVILGIRFVGLQLLELDEITVKIIDSRFHASRFCTVGLHFSHVLLGVVGLCTVLAVGRLKFGYYRCTVLTWYWHFVDYVWLFVYTFVYVC